MRVEQTPEELQVELAEQRRFLAVSCAAFDAGDHAEAKRIATVLQILLHGRGSGPALLEELGTRAQMGWLDTAGSILPVIAGAQTPLVYVMKVEHAASMWMPTLDAWDRRLQERPLLPAETEETLAQLRAEHALRSRGGWLPFDEWWDAEVLRNREEQTFSRAALVQMLTTTDGAARLDPYFGGGPRTSPVLASMRQVAFEVERSLHRASPATEGTPP
jgi:hypothetical protein